MVFTPKGTFQVPFVPFLPSLGALATLHLVGSLGALAYARWAIWFTAGTLVYLCYGMWHSYEGSGSYEGGSGGGGGVELAARQASTSIGGWSGAGSEGRRGLGRRGDILVHVCYCILTRAAVAASGAGGRAVCQLSKRVCACLIWGVGQLRQHSKGCLLAGCLHRQGAELDRLRL